MVNAIHFINMNFQGEPGEFPVSLLESIVGEKGDKGSMGFPGESIVGPPGPYGPPGKSLLGEGEDVFDLSPEIIVC